MLFKELSEKGYKKGYKTQQQRQYSLMSCFVSGNCSESLV